MVCHTQISIWVQVVRSIGRQVFWTETLWWKMDIIDHDCVNSSYSWLFQKARVAVALFRWGKCRWLAWGHSTWVAGLGQDKTLSCHNPLYKLPKYARDSENAEVVRGPEYTVPNTMVPLQTPNTDTENKESESRLFPWLQTCGVSENSTVPPTHHSREMKWRAQEHTAAE